MCEQRQCKSQAKGVAGPDIIGGVPYIRAMAETMVDRATSSII